ncbi:hypothetical protein DPEC_G00052280 [Dallia pectoralis]|uniref:Uncharacterized protein n=1 Tax=Dallia pectoralis TaxID=75939 RepID=A0ACC2HCV9_DALPE|nr:hypothetical protein DPEC_G00052280 [Dallia pectoralis]
MGAGLVPGIELSPYGGVYTFCTRPPSPVFISTTAHHPLQLGDVCLSPVRVHDCQVGREVADVLPVSPGADCVLLNTHGVASFAWGLTPRCHASVPRRACLVAGAAVRAN